MDAEEQQYFGTVEEHFVRRRGRPLLLSPADVQRVGQWWRDGVPLRTVLEAIDIHFDRLARRGREPRRAVTLAWLEDDVLDAWAGAKRRRAGLAVATGEGATAAPLASTDEHARLVAALDHAATELLRRGTEPDASVAASVARAADKLRGKASLFDPVSGDHDDQRAEDYLRRLERKIMDDVREALGDEALRVVEGAVAAELVDKRGAMALATYERVNRQLVDKRLRERFGLQRLSLFYA